MLSDALIVGVLSCRRNEPRRELCRRLWADRLVAAGVEVLFVVGDPEAPVSGRLAGDVLELRVADDYRSLPQKIRALSGYLLRDRSFQCLFKCDDDTFVQPQRIVALSHSASGDYVGHLWGRDLPVPMVYAHGGAGYLLSRAAVQCVTANMTSHATGAEDGHVALALAANGIRLEHDERLRPIWEATRLPSPVNDTITAHPVNSEERSQFLLDLW